MAMESSVIPLPSELVMPPAGYWAAEGKMNIIIAILCGTAGSLVGAYINYFAARYLGRPLILKYGKYVWITEEKFAKVETFSTNMAKYQPSSAGSAGGARTSSPSRQGWPVLTLEIRPLYAARRRSRCTVLALIGYIIGETRI